MALTRSVVVVLVFFPAVALFQLTVVVAARICVEVSRFWGFGSSSWED
jgi:hypothetical protein